MERGERAFLVDNRRDAPPRPLHGPRRDFPRGMLRQEGTRLPLVLLGVPTRRIQAGADRSIHGIPGR